MNLVGNLSVIIKDNNKGKQPLLSEKEMIDFLMSKFKNKPVCTESLLEIEFDVIKNYLKMVDSGLISHESYKALKEGLVVEFDEDSRAVNIGIEV